VTEDDARRLFAEEIGQIAPEIPFEEVDPSADLREAFEIDSMDFLNLVTALSQRLKMPIPEADYPQLATVDAATAYIAARAGRAAPAS
jgi:acyl carrier protein